jgi:two-component system, chemotaxis family, chemotaxis protein CheY
VVTSIIIDDDPEILYLVSEFFKKNSIEILGMATNGKAGFELYKNLKPDVVITDLSMPEYDGNYVIKSIKKLNSKAKIMVLTSYPDFSFEKDEVWRVFYKPYDIYHLIDSILKLKSIKNNFLKEVET